MKKFLGISLLLMFLMMNSVTSYSQTMETYTRTTVLDLKWGKGPNEIGYYKEGPEDAEGLRFGPASFEIAEDGTIFILDSQNRRMIHFDTSGRPIHEFVIHGSGGTALDDKGNIYINYGFQNTILMYNTEGRLIQRIMYGSKKTDLYSSELTLSDGIFYNLNSKILIDPIVLMNGDYGEEIFQAKTENISRDEHPDLIGKTSKRTYRSKKRKYLFKNEKQVDVDIFSGYLSDNDMPIFLSEDTMGNSYFNVLKMDIKKQYIYKFNDKMQLMSIIGPLPWPWYTEFEKDLIIQDHAVYQLHCSKEGVRLYMWTNK